MNKEIIPLMFLNIIISIFIFFVFIIGNFYYKFLNQQINNVSSISGKTMGTYWQVKIPNLKNKVYIQNLIQKNLNHDENMISSWKNNSIVSKFNKLPKYKRQIINKNFFRMIATALKINKKTYGKLDITMSRLIDLWGFGIKDKPKKPPSLKVIKKNIMLSGSKYLKIIHHYNKLYLEKSINGIKINLSTVGEGFAVDHISYILKKKGIKNYTISIGGTVLVNIQKNQEIPKIIAIQQPTDKKEKIHLLVYLKNNAISTSGSYRNYYYLNKHRISHLIDPDTGKPIKHNLVSVSVISSTALEADSWDSGLLILGFKQAQRLSLKERLAVCLIKQEKSSFSTWVSPKFKKFLVK